MRIEGAFPGGKEKLREERREEFWAFLQERMGYRCKSECGGQVMSGTGPSSVLIVNAGELPREGRRLHGEIDREVFDLPDRLALPASGIRYDLLALRIGEEVLVRGSIEADFDLQCVVTLDYFPHRVRLDPYVEAFELGPDERVDLTGRLREDILLALPAYPRREGAESLLETERRQQGGENRDAPGASPVWDVLDALDSGEQSETR
ncbi:MAG TPA: hypothetical protein VMN36_14880 [Verrucomicrobiales bacterium]|nr:hypothetical protein [Verrucomicrobiales bacterium]